MKRFLVALAVLQVVASGGGAHSASPLVVLRGTPMLSGVMFVMDGQEERAMLYFVIHARGSAVDSSGKHSGGWFEARISATHDDEDSATFGGELSAEQIGLTYPDGGWISLPLGRFGTARISVAGMHRHLEFEVPATDVTMRPPAMYFEMSVTGPNDNWAAQVTLNRPYVVDGSGTLGKWSLTARSPLAPPSHDPFLFFGSRGSATVRPHRVGPPL